MKSFLIVYTLDATTHYDMVSAAGHAHAGLALWAQSPDAVVLQIQFMG